MLMMLDFGALPAVDITTSRMGRHRGVCEVVPCHFCALQSDSLAHALLSALRIVKRVHDGLVAGDPCLFTLVFARQLMCKGTHP